MPIIVEDLNWYEYSACRWFNSMRIVMNNRHSRVEMDLFDICQSSEMISIRLLAQQFASMIIDGYTVCPYTGRIVQVLSTKRLEAFLLEFRELLARDVYGIFIEMCLAVLAWKRNDLLGDYTRQQLSLACQRLVTMITTSECIPSVQQTTSEEFNEIVSWLEEHTNRYWFSVERVPYSCHWFGVGRRMPTFGSIYLSDRLSASTVESVSGSGIWPYHWDVPLPDSMDEALWMLRALERKRYFMSPHAFARCFCSVRCNETREIAQLVARQYKLYPEWLSSRLLRCYLEIFHDGSERQYTSGHPLARFWRTVDNGPRMMAMLQTLREVLEPADFDALIAHYREEALVQYSSEFTAVWGRVENAIHELEDLESGHDIVISDEVQVVVCIANGL